MEERKFKRGSFVLVSSFSHFIQNRIGIVVGYEDTKTLVYVIDIDITIRVEDENLKEV